MKNRSKKKAMISIEASLIVPLLFLVIILFTDLAYISYVKTSSVSKIELSIINSKEDISSLNNHKFNQGNRYPKDIDIYIEEKLNRSILDSFNYYLDNKSLKDRLNIELKRSLPDRVFERKTINYSHYRKIFSNNFKLNYSFKIKSALEKLYRKLNLKIDHIEGKKSFREERLFDELITIDIIYENIGDSDLIKKLKESQEKIKKIKKSK